MAPTFITFLIVGTTLLATGTVSSLPLLDPLLDLPEGSYASTNCSSYCLDNDGLLKGVLCCLEEKGLSFPIFSALTSAKCILGTMYCTTPLNVNPVFLLPASNSSQNATGCPTSVQQREPFCDQYCGSSYNQTLLGECCQFLNTQKSIPYPFYVGGACAKIDCLHPDLNTVHAYCDYLDNVGFPA